jgi:hypothetical protein
MVLAALAVRELEARLLQLDLQVALVAVAETLSMREVMEGAPQFPAMSHIFQPDTLDTVRLADQD